MRSVWPDRYRAVVEQARSFILNAKDVDDQKEEATRKLRAKRKRQSPKPATNAKEKARPSVKAALNLPRLRALFSLRKLSRALQSDVMSDGSIAKKFDIPTHRPVNLGPDISLPQDRLLAAFRRVAGQPARPLIGDDGKRIKATIRIVDNGTAQIKIGERVFAFAHAGLLSPYHKQRLEFLERYLKERTVSDVYANELRAKVQASKLSDDEFLSAVEALLTSQESCVQTVRGKVAAGDLTNSDLLPDDARYWDNLITPWEGSKTLEEFLRKECEAERAKVMAQNPLRAFYTSSLSYCSPVLVPVETFRTVAAEVVLQCMDRAASLPDHFAVTGAFEICADRLTDRRFEAAGVKLLDQLLGDMEQLKNRCTFFAAMFVMATARLAQHQESA